VFGHRPTFHPTGYMRSSRCRSLAPSHYILLTYVYNRASSGIGTHGFHMTGRPGRLLVYDTDSPWIRMPSITCQTMIFTGPPFEGRSVSRVLPSSLANAWWPRLTTHPGQVCVTGQISVVQSPDKVWLDGKNQYVGHLEY
jgi:hypothetical protein